MRLNSITDLDKPELEPYRTLRESTQHWRGGHFVAESDKVVRALLESDLRVISVLLTDEWLEKLSNVLNDPRRSDTEVYLAPVSLIEEIVGYSLHRGVMAIGEIPPNPVIDNILHQKHSGQVLVALEGIADAENMGMILRNCAAFGVDGVLVGADSCSPWLRRSVRVSVGHMFGLHIRVCDDLLGELRHVRETAGLRVVGTSPQGGDLRTQLSKGKDGDSGPRPLCLFFGSEARGLSASALDCCDEVFTIPMKNGVDSINVANAVAVALYAAMAEYSGD